MASSFTGYYQLQNFIKIEWDDRMNVLGELSPSWGTEKMNGNFRQDAAAETRRYVLLLELICLAELK
jgi:hypothetical protein